MIPRIFNFVLAILCSAVVMGQQLPAYMNASDRMATDTLKKSLIDNSLLANMQSTNIGPTVQSGRVADIAVHPDDPSVFYVAYASGGLWKTINNGTSFEPIFDHQAVMTIGAIAVDWVHNVIWVGTGEVNSSRSSYAGNGVYKSSDDGKTWQYKGLPESHHIGKIILHPTILNTAWVAVLGHLYSNNKERGLYKTTDGGDTWSQTLVINDQTGVVDLVIDPINPDELYAASWQRERKAWNFVESGIGSGIYKSTDGGNTWAKISGGSSGFPSNEGVGRIGLAIYNDGTESKLYAFLDNYNRQDKKEDKEEDDKSLKKEDFRTMTSGAFAQLSDDKLANFLKSNDFPEKYSAKAVKEKVAKESIKPSALTEYLEDANSLLFDTEVIGAQVYVSTDKGSSWSITHDGLLDGIIYSYGYYFGQIRVAPHNANKVYIMGVPILKSTDGGANWKSINGDNVHADHHALWINPTREGHLINGNDGGINISYDDGEHWIKCNSPSVGQFYYVNVDNEEPYNVYGGLQDNGVWVGPNNYEESSYWHQSGHYPYQSIMGGDGMQIQIDNRDVNTVYTGFQFGNYFRINRENKDRTYITPKHELGDRPYRWNWQSPILLSPHNQDIMYMGSNVLLRSMDKGDNFEEISKDLTAGGKKGDVAYGTLTTIDESVLKFGLIYTGSDDGKINVTKDGGNTWTEISTSLPQHLWISRVQASKHKESRVYTSLNAYRQDDFKAYVYVSDDYGATWKDIASALPHEPVNVIKEDPSDENIIYVGTDHGTYVSTDMGTSYMLLSNDMPKVPVHDLVIHPRHPHLIIGTHGRSIYKIDIAAIREMDHFKNQNLALISDKKIKHNRRAGAKRFGYSEAVKWNLTFDVFSSKKQGAKINIYAGDKKLISSTDIDLLTGISHYSISLNVPEKNVSTLEKALNKDKKNEDKISLEKAEDGQYYLPKGEYIMEISNGSDKSSKTLTID